MATTAEVAALEGMLEAAQAQEAITAEAAAAALRDALDAKCESLHAWIRLAKARGSTEDFRLTYQETAILTLRRLRSCERIVRRTLRVGWLARIGLF